MKKVVSLILLGLMFLFSGCGAPRIYNTIPNIEKEKFSIVLEIDEDIVCKNEYAVFNFKKGDKFGGYSFKGKAFSVASLPDYAIGFPIHPFLDFGLPGDIYLILQENGTPVFEEVVFLGLLNSGENLMGRYPNIICYKNNIAIPIKFNLRSEN